MNNIKNKLKNVLFSGESLIKAYGIKVAKTFYIKQKNKNNYNRIQDILIKNYSFKEDLTEGTILLEGGAFRGVYATGVVDCLLDSGIFLNKVYGVSAGALNGMNYIAGCRGRGAMFPLLYRHDSRLVSYKEFIKSKNLINLDFYFNEFNHQFPLSSKDLFLDDKELIVLATNLETGEPEFFSSKKTGVRNFYKAIKASASMPCLANPVKIGTKNYLDGGCYCGLPLTKLIKDGCKNIIVVGTKPKSFHLKKNNSIIENIATSKIYQQYPAFLKTLKQSNNIYNKNIELANKLEQEGKIIYIAPEQVDISRLENNLTKLGNLYQQGYDECLVKLPEIKQMLKIN